MGSESERTPAVTPRPVPRRESPWGLPEGDQPTQVLSYKDGIYSPRPALKETHSRRYRALSSFSGNACALNLGRNQQNHSTTCKLNPQR
ncbi:hypothetical protein RJ641_018079 [Dillenia turbinata]|uniref:Uncharacterized protein n=1 Tax=Dillenia turbinata TaxID=194707 RepID=A0AAN8Z1J9_9MAGN